MYRFSLILTLAALQLLGGSGKAVYLCVSNDGTACCFDSGPLSCTCCRHEKESCNDSKCEVASVNCESGCCHHDEGGNQSNNDRSPASDSLPVLTTDGCGCTHELVSRGECAGSPRLSVGERVLVALQHLDCLPNVIQHRSLNGLKDRLDWRGPPPLPDVAISVLSIVAIRC